MKAYHAIGSFLVALLACGGDDTDGSTAQASTGALMATSTGVSMATSAGVPPLSTGTSAPSATAASSSGAPETGCEAGNLLPLPEDTSLPGPWPVGATTTMIGDLRVEVWYPAEVGSEADASVLGYDIRQQLPAADINTIPDEANAPQLCDCYADLPLDTEHGPYPVIVFVHGTAGFRTQSLPQMTHWASRGFIVLAADHPGLRLSGQLGLICNAAEEQHLDTDLAQMLSAIALETPGLESVASAMDPTRLGMAGHSAGGGAIATYGDTAQVLIPMAMRGVSAGSELRSTLVMGATADAIVAYSNARTGYDDSPAPKRFVGIEGAGHLVFSEVCELRNDMGNNILEVANEYQVCGAQFAGLLFQCDKGLTPNQQGWEIINYATSAAFEETLHCSSAGENFGTITTKFPLVAEFLEE